MVASALKLDPRVRLLAAGAAFVALLVPFRSVNFGPYEREVAFPYPIATGDPATVEKARSLAVPNRAENALAAYTTQAHSLQAQAGVASAGQRRAAARILRAYFDANPIVTPFGSESTIAQADRADLMIRAMVEDGDIEIDGDGRVSATPKGLASTVTTSSSSQPGRWDSAVLGFELGRYRVIAVDAIEKLPADSHGFDAIRNHYRRTLDLTPLGETLLQAGWSNSGARIGTACAWQACYDAPARLQSERARRRSVGSDAAVFEAERLDAGPD